MGERQAVVEKFVVYSHKRAAGKGREPITIRTRIGVAQEFTDGNIHVVLNALPLDAQIWLVTERNDRERRQSFNDEEIIPDPVG